MPISLAGCGLPLGMPSYPAPPAVRPAPRADARTPRRGRLRRVGAFGAVLGAGGIAAAPGVARPQAAPSGAPTATAAPPAAACLATIPGSDLTRVAVFAVVELGDVRDGAIASGAATFVQTLAEHAGRLLGATADTLPAGEPAISWRDLDGALRVTAVRAGPVTWDLERDSTGRVRGGAAVRLLARAADTARALGEVSLAWPETLTTDTVRFRVVLRRPWVDSSGAVRPTGMAYPVPLLTVGVPREVPVRVVRIAPPEYPESAQRGAVTGTLVVRFVVDTSGRADPASVDDVWPTDRPRPTGNLGDHYAAFLDAVRRAISAAQFTPARVGPCVVPRLVQQPFTFRLPH